MQNNTIMQQGQRCREKWLSPLFLTMHVPAWLAGVIFMAALLCAADAHAAEVTLAWEPSPDPVVGYTVFYGEQSVLTNPSTEKPVGKELTCTITGLLPGHTYYFAVKAYYDDATESGFSNEVTYTVPDSDTTTTMPPGCTDNDGDGFGVGSGCIRAQDCDDADQEVHPWAKEICEDGIDNNCNGLIDEDCDGKKCPAVNLLGENSPDLESIRSFRDKALAKNAMGRRIIFLYYTNADSINAALDHSPALRTMARRLLETVASKMEGRG